MLAATATAWRLQPRRCPAAATGAARSLARWPAGCTAAAAAAAPARPAAAAAAAARCLSTAPAAQPDPGADLNWEREIGNHFAPQSRKLQRGGPYPQSDRFFKKASLRVSNVAAGATIEQLHQLFADVDPAEQSRNVGETQICVGEPDAEGVRVVTMPLDLCKRALYLSGVEVEGEPIVVEMQPHSAAAGDAPVSAPAIPTTTWFTRSPAETDDRRRLRRTAGSGRRSGAGLRRTATTRGWRAVGRAVRSAPRGTGALYRT